MSNIKISKKSSEKSGKKHLELTIKGDLVLQNINEIKKELKKTLKNYDYVNIKGKNIERADITFVQIIESLKKQMNKKEEILTTDIEYSYDLKTLFLNAGFNI